MNEVKEIFESLSTRIRSPYFGYVFFFAVFLNWKAWYFLAFEDVSVLDKFKYFECETTTTSLIYYPLGFALLAVIVSPWLRFLFVLIAKHPTTLRNILQVQSESKILEEKNKLEKLRNELQAQEEDKIISQAERDAKVRSIKDEESRDLVQKQLDELRSSIENSNKQDVKSKETANITVSLRKTPSGKGYRFYFKNIGSGVATNVNFKLVLEEGKSTPLTSDYEEVFPVKELHPGDEVSVLAAISMGMGSKFDSILSWDDSDGIRIEHNKTITF